MYDLASWIWVLVPLLAIVGAFTSGIVSTLSRARVRELEIRERIAMIEKGLVPPPEVDPGGFDRAMGRLEPRVWPGVMSRGAGRHRRAGITLIGVGIGLMVLIGVAGDAPQTGLGVGGFLAVIGAAFVAISLLEGHQDLPAPPPAGSDRPRQG